MGGAAAEQSAAAAVGLEPGETAAQSRTIDAFLKRLVITPIRNSRLVDVRFVSTNPSRAAQVVNAVVRAYIDSTMSVKFMASKEASDWLGQQLTEQRAKVEASELALQQYRERGDAVALEDRENIVVQRLADLNAAVTKARAERMQKEALHNRVRSIQGDPAVRDSIPAILSNTFIQQLKGDLAERQSQLVQLAENLGDKHPDILKMRSTIAGHRGEAAGRDCQGRRLPSRTITSRPRRRKRRSPGRSMRRRPRCCSSVARASSTA